MKTSYEMKLEDLVEQSQARLENIFTMYVNKIPSLELKAAMQDALANKGKYIRPLLVYATACIFNTPWENADVPAAAVELLHTYSLIHDDLPSMDNADLRRGKPSCHKVHGEGMAVLVGDALQALSMQVLSSHPAPLKAANRVQMLAVLSEAAGPYGMVAGQALDLAMMGNGQVSGDLLIDIYRLKTGALFSASVQLGFLAAQQEDDFNRQAIKDFGDLIGLAFQIQDDILDIDTETAISGKPQQLDSKNNKLSYPLVFGVLAAKNKVSALYSQAFDKIKIFGLKAHLLRDLTNCMLTRKN